MHVIWIKLPPHDCRRKKPQLRFHHSHCHWKTKHINCSKIYVGIIEFAKCFQFTNIPIIPIHVYSIKKFLLKKHTLHCHMYLSFTFFFTLKPPTSNTHQTERTRSSLSHLERKRPLHKNRKALLDLKKSSYCVTYCTSKYHI